MLASRTAQSRLFLFEDPEFLPFFFLVKFPQTLVTWEVFERAGSVTREVVLCSGLKKNLNAG